MDLWSTRRAAGSLIFGLLSAGSLAAQYGGALAVGERVRAYSSRGTFDGRFLSLDTDTLRLAPAGRAEPLAIALGTLARLEVQRGRQSAAGKGALIGFGIGAAAGVTLAVATSQTCEEGRDPGCLGPGIEAIAGAVVVGFAGAGVGALVGSVTRQDRWVTVPVRRPRASVTPLSGGVRLTVTAAF